MSDAGQPVKCEQCGREYICTPADDHYRTPEGRGVCERCLVGSLPVHTYQSRLSNYPGGWFGKSWGAPVCDPVNHMPTPVGEECLMCEMTIIADDQGLTIPHASAAGVELRSMHIGCFLKDIGVET